MRQTFFAAVIFSLLIVFLGVAESSCKVTQTDPPTQTCDFTVSWNDNSLNEQGFRLERKVMPAGQWVEVSKPAMNAETIQDTIVDDPGSTEHCWRLAAYNATGNSNWTTPDVCLTTDIIVAAPPTLPGGLTVTRTP